jgi:hypothetical protein
MEPQQGLSTAELLGVMGMVQQVQQLATFPRTELESRHASPPSREGVAKPVPIMKTLSSTYLTLTVSEWARRRGINRLDQEALAPLLLTSLLRLLLVRLEDAQPPALGLGVQPGQRLA